MAQIQPNYSEIVNQLPEKIRVRFNSLGTYVAMLVNELKGQMQISRDFSSEEIQLIQLLAFVYSLEKFMRDGSKAARSASESLREFNLPGFQVGTTTFTPQNRNTRLGEILAKELLDSIIRATNENVETPSYSFLRNTLRYSRSIRDLVRRMMREIDRNA